MDQLMKEVMNESMKEKKNERDEGGT